MYDIKLYYEKKRYYRESGGGDGARRALRLWELIRLERTLLICIHIVITR